MDAGDDTIVFIGAVYSALSLLGFVCKNDRLIGIGRR